VAGVHERPPTSRRDLTLALSAVAAIFAGLIGTNVLDTCNSARWMGKLDHAAVVLWLPALLLLALCAYKSPTENKWLREGAWAATALAGLVTAVVLLLTGFGFTRDTDHVRLLLSKTGMKSLRTLCGVHADHIDGIIRTKTLQEEFVIFNFEENSKPETKPEEACENSVDIPRADVVGIQEVPDPGKNP
jgi:hypothetical protein